METASVCRLGLQVKDDPVSLPDEGIRLAVEKTLKEELSADQTERRSLNGSQGPMGSPSAVPAAPVAVGVLVGRRTGDDRQTPSSQMQRGNSVMISLQFYKSGIQ